MPLNVGNPGGPLPAYMNTGHPELDNKAEKHGCGICRPAHCPCEAHRTASACSDKYLEEGAWRATVPPQPRSYSGPITAPPGHEVEPAPRMTASEVLANNGQEADPAGIPANVPGAKLDSGKAPIFRGLLQYFPRAAEKVALLSLYGAEKYTWKGWEAVPGGIDRYGDATSRHVVKEQVEGLYDSEWAARGKTVLHATAVAWNALARLELILRDLEQNTTK